MLSDIVQLKKTNLCSSPNKCFTFLNRLTDPPSLASPKQKESLVLHLLVHVENAQHTAQDGFFGLLGSNAVPDVAQSRAKVRGARREASPEELHH